MKHYTDNFAHNSLPSIDLQPTYLKGKHETELLNCVECLLDVHIQNGHGNAPCLRTFEETWTYYDLYEKANQMAHVLIDDLGLQSGNRVLLRSANNPMMVACWFAVLKAGGIVV
ncbi:MAG: AMP-binding protein, partial [Flavobacterium sp.]|nr:AMP-binding protein [Flavobacterium sp.]